MMDTILNLGLNDKTVEGLAELTGDPRFAFDSYRRFIQMYGDVVLGVDHGAFEDILENFKNLNGFAADTDLDEEAWREIIADYKARDRARARRAISAGHERAALGRHRGGLQFLAQSARRNLSPAARHSRRLGHRRHRAGDGLRKPRRQLRDRRCLHAQSFDGREGDFRRISAERPGRRRRRRNSHAAAADEEKRRRSTWRLPSNSRCRKRSQS